MFPLNHVQFHIHAVINSVVSTHKQYICLNGQICRASIVIIKFFWLLPWNIYTHQTGGICSLRSNCAWNIHIHICIQNKHTNTLLSVYTCLFAMQMQTTLIPVKLYIYIYVTRPKGKHQHIFFMNTYIQQVKLECTP